MSDSAPPLGLRCISLPDLTLLIKQASPVHGPPLTGPLLLDNNVASSSHTGPSKEGKISALEGLFS